MAQSPGKPPAHVPLTEKDGSVTKVWYKFLANKNPFTPAQQGLTALSGGAQVGATQLQFGANIFSTVAVIGDSAILQPPTGSGSGSFVVNHGAHSMNVFPSPGTNINLLANDTAYAVPSGKCALFIDTNSNPNQYDGGTWG